MQDIEIILNYKIKNKIERSFKGKITWTRKDTYPVARIFWEKDFENFLKAYFLDWDRIKPHNREKSGFNLYFTRSINHKEFFIELENTNKKYIKKYYWVNQGRTWKTEREKSFLWAPFLTQSNRERDDWIILKNLNPGDIVFSYVSPYILAYSIVTRKWIDFDKPKEFNKKNPWTTKGMRVDVQYIDFNPIKIDKDFKNNLLPFRDTYDNDKDWIFDVNMNVKQKYLMPLTMELGKYLSSIVNAPLLGGDHTPESEPTPEKPRGQGFSKKFKKITEMYAMDVVRNIFEEKGYIVEDVSNIRPSYGCDFLCIKQGKGIVYCEVKGTTGSDEYVFITKNEYEKSKEYGKDSALYIVYNIDIDEDTDPPTASGGDITFFHPWGPNDPKNCDPYVYKFYPDDHE